MLQNPPLRQAAKRYAQSYLNGSATKEEATKLITEIKLETDKSNENNSLKTEHKRSKKLLIN